jgi:N-acetylmuramic acid 6-phosphate etherase
MKAGTATKLVLNTLTTGAMIRVGKTYGNLMVDLQATNAKLVVRGQRIVMEIAGVGRDQAHAAITAAGGSVRTAIVMLRRGVGREEAERLLAAHDHHLRSILGDPPPVTNA